MPPLLNVLAVGKDVVEAGDHSRLRIDREARLLEQLERRALVCKLGRRIALPGRLLRPSRPGHGGAHDLVGPDVECPPGGHAGIALAE